MLGKPHLAPNVFNFFMYLLLVQKLILKIMCKGWALVAHAYNPSYSGGRDQKDLGSKPAQANSSRDPTLKKPNTKKG
jgi:hypothetical protein